MRTLVGLATLTVLLFSGAVVASTFPQLGDHALPSWFQPTTTSAMSAEGQGCVGYAMVTGAPVPADLVASVEIAGDFHGCQAAPSSVTVTFHDGSSVTTQR